MELVKSRQEALLEPQEQVGPVCQHHWLLDRPAGPVSKGVCRTCGEERQFQNYLESSSWGYDVSLEHLSGGSRLPAGIDLDNAYSDSSVDEDA